MLAQGRTELAALREALQNSPELRELASTPLMLSVLAQAYHGIPLPHLLPQQAALEAQIWSDYVERMVHEKGAECRGKQDVPGRRYPLKQTQARLAWLAQQMRGRHLTLFSGEALHEDWLPASQQRAARWLLIVLPAIVMGACASFLLVLFASSLFLPGPTEQATFWQVGLIGGGLSWCLCANQRKDLKAVEQRAWWSGVRPVRVRRLLKATGLALLVALCFSLAPQDQVLTDPSRRILHGLIFGGSFLAGAYVLQEIIPHLTQIPAHATARWSSALCTLVTRRGFWFTIVPGICTMLGYYCTDWLAFWPLYGLVDGLIYGLAYGLIYGVALSLVSYMLDAQTGNPHFAERLSWTWRPLIRPRHVQKSLLAGLAYGCFILLSQMLLKHWFGNGLQSGLIYWRQDGQSNILAIFSPGPGGSLSIGLSYWAIVGLYQGIRQEHLEERDRRHFNQGLQRSLRHGAFFSLLGAGLVTCIGIVSNLLSAVLNRLLSAGAGNLPNFSLRQGLDMGLSLAWALFFCGWFILWSATGGFTIWRHSIIRLLLARSQTFPMDARRFLDDATARILLRRVGGGYSFVHRRLLDYFAHLADTPGETVEETR